VTAPVDSRPASGHHLSDEALETSKLVLELVHVAYATRTADRPPAPSADGHGADGRGPSPHAIRAAIHLHQHGTRTIGELADGLGVSVGWASRIVHELETAGLAARDADPADRRIARVRLTPEAVRLVEGAYRWRGDAIERALAVLDEPGRAAVRAFLRNAVDELAQAGRERGSAPRPGR
jgi:DNA-binding MarR family transcriptional regulator